MTEADDPDPKATEPPESPLHLARRDAGFVLGCLASDGLPLNAVPDELLDSLARELRPIRCPPRTVLCRSGERPEGVSFIQDGVVELVTGERCVVTQALRRGDVLGLEELISDRPAPRLARAASHVSGLFLPREPLRTVLSAHPSTIPLLLSGLAHRLVTAGARLAAVLDGGVEQRTAKMLLLEERNGILPLSQSALAAMAGVSRPSFNRALKALHAKRALEIHYRQIRILDKSLLSAAATAGTTRQAPDGRAPAR